LVEIEVVSPAHFINHDFCFAQVSWRLSWRECSMFTNIELVQKDDKNTIKLTVDQGSKKPYYLSDKGLRPSGVYVRCGTTAAPASEDAIRMMIKMTDGDKFENNRSLITTHAVNTLKEMLSKDMIKKVGSGRLTRYVVKSFLLKLWL